jgi:hypothetical protein
MVLSIFKWFWFLLVLVSAIAAALLGASQYGAKIDFASWTMASGLTEISGLSEIPLILNNPLIDSYGFYAGLLLFLTFLVVYEKTLSAILKSKTGDDYSFDTDTSALAPAPISESDDRRSTAASLAATVRADTLDKAIETNAIEANNDSDMEDTASEWHENERDDKWSESSQDFKNKEE